MKSFEMQSILLKFMDKIICTCVDNEDQSRYVLSLNDILLIHNQLEFLLIQYY